MIIKSIFCILFVTLLVNVWAKEYPKIDFPLSGETLMGFSGSPINFSAIVPNVNSNQLSNLNNSDIITRYKNTYELVIKNNFALDEDAEVVVTSNLKYYPIDGSAPVSTVVKLSVDFRSGVLQKSNISNIFVFSDAYRIDVSITDMYVSGSNVQQLKNKLKDFVEIVASFQEESIKKTGYTTTVGGLTACEDVLTDELVIKWNPNDFAEEYELEYTFVDNYGNNLNTPMNPNQLKYDFKDNSTRISTKETYYRLPLLFERGYILYRVRIIGRGGQNLNLPVYCIWTGGTDRGIVQNFQNKFSCKAHMSDHINWQVSSSFSEDGKRSDVVKYFDGTFRSRQEVSGVNFEKQDLSNQGFTINSLNSQGCNLPGSKKNREVIAGETIYDFQGRPSVNVLPAPTNSLKIQYFPRLNISDATQEPYDFRDFDKAALGCNSTNKLSNNIFSNIMGSSSYYSFNNPNQSGFNAFIPDAQSYPFTQLMYLQDNTNRVSVQSGLGENFKMGSGHETRFLYAAPNQAELDRMFGTEAGLYKRYQKNAIIDPNGQVSITYLNPEGKTIATSLAGDAPGNLTALNQSLSPLVVPIISEVNNVDKTIIAEHQFIVVKDNTIYNFSYNIIPEFLNTTICETTACLDCIYDIEISLDHMESCTNIPLFKYSGTIGQLMNGDAVDLSCNYNSSSGTYPMEFSNTLVKGTYKITKKLTVNEDAAIRYVDEIFKDTCQAWTDILNDELSRIDTMDCFNSCQECDDPPVQTEDCNTDYCEPNPNRCDIIRGMMLSDVSPGGQYGKFNRDEDNLVIAHNFNNSVFHYAGSEDKRNKLISILENIPTGIFSYDPNLYLNNNPDAEEDDLWANLQLNLTEFLNNWQSDYAEYFIPLHPEYCLLGWCTDALVNVKPSLDFDVKILSTQFYQDALNKGYIDQISPHEQLLNSDPWFSGLPLRSVMLSALENYGCGNSTMSADVLAMHMAYCAYNNQLPQVNHQNTQPTPQMNSPLVPTCNPPVNYLSTHIFGSDPLLADLEWTFLRAIYLSAKENMLQYSMSDYSNSQSPPCLSCPNTNSLICRFSDPTSTSLNAVNNSGITSVNLNDINSSDPCEVTDAVIDQSNTVNQQFGSYYCGNSSQTSNTNQNNNSAQNFPNSSGIILTLTPGSCDSCCFDITINGLQNYYWNAFKLSVNQNSITNVFPAPGINLRSSSSGQVILSNNSPFQIGSFVGKICFNRVNLAFPVEVVWSTNSGAVFFNEVTSRNLTCSLPCSQQSGQFCDSILQFGEYPYSNNCVDGLLATAYANASVRYNNWVESMKNTILREYYEKCLSAIENFNMEYDDLQYHYTLYYYDQAGNLVKTIPPEGVRLLNPSEIQQVETSRSNNYQTAVLPAHIKQTVYRYNTLNEAIWQKTPDAGVTEFYYDGLGRIVASQNEEQSSEGTYAYTKYDLLGRIEESGKVKTNIINSTFTRNFSAWHSFISNVSNRSEITLSKYDKFYLPQINQKFGALGQRNLRKRIASILKFADEIQLSNQNYSHATHYSYDIQGNVYKLIQDYPTTPIGDKVIEYDYDLHSGKVNSVLYQRGAPDQFIHKYSYDALNRLIRVKTSPDSFQWSTDAEYFYYRHGPLARLELGEDKVQGLDYMYTLQGWIKGVNGTTLNPETDMGLDGYPDPLTGSPQVKNVNGMTVNQYSNNQILGSNNFKGPGYSALHNTFARDAFGYVLDYFDGDYKPVNTSIGNRPLSALNQSTGNINWLYNGNISRMYTQIQNLGNMGFNYTYDQLNRLKSQEGWELSSSGHMSSIGDKYKMELTYDRDGNITTLLRNGAANLNMDNLKYYYYTRNMVGTYLYDPLNTQNIPNDAANMLAYVEDDLGFSGNYQSDIDNQNPGNYTYDMIGNLRSDISENIVNIDWNLQNKIKKIEKTNYSLLFDYDALGNRVMKHMTGIAPTSDIHTYYVRDAQGNILAAYSFKTPQEQSSQQLFWDEAHIYGSSRLGLYNPEMPMENSNVTSYKKGSRGFKQYELTNHLGNVLTTITDRKLPELQTGAKTYTADILSSQDYYPFGMLMPERTSNTDKYKFGFNGKENDNDVKGVGNQQDYGMRIYDTRIGRFLSTDPITKKYPWYTPYQFAGNKSLNSIDLDGLEEFPVYSSRIFLEFDIGVKYGSKNLEDKLTEKFNVSGYKIDLQLTLPNARVTGKIFYDTKTRELGLENLKGEASLIGIKAKVEKNGLLLNKFEFSPKYSHDFISEKTYYMEAKNKSVFWEGKFSGGDESKFKSNSTIGFNSEYKKWGISISENVSKITTPEIQWPIPSVPGLYAKMQFSIGIEKHDLKGSFETWFPKLPEEAINWDTDKTTNWIEKNEPINTYKWDEKK